jgi:hypothetical protein
LKRSSGLRDIFMQFERDARALPPMVLVDAYQRTPIAPYVLEKKEWWVSWLDMLRRARAGPFARMPEDPEYRAVLVTDKNSIKVGTDVYQLTEPRLIYALRVKYAYAQMKEPALFVFRWGIAAPNENQFQRSLPQEGKEDSILVWIDGPIKQFQVIPNAKGTGAKLVDVELLVPIRSAR